MGMLVLIATLGISFSQAAECTTPCRDAANEQYSICIKKPDTSTCETVLNTAIKACGDECPAESVMGITCDPDLLVN